MKLVCAFLEDFVVFCSSISLYDDGSILLSFVVLTTAMSSFVSFFAFGVVFEFIKKRDVYLFKFRRLYHL